MDEEKKNIEAAQENEAPKQEAEKSAAVPSQIGYTLN